MNTSTSPNVQYGYAAGAANTIRPTSLTYPDGRVLTYGYGTADGMNDAASRVNALIDDDGSSTHLADYDYLGSRTFVECDYTQPQVRWTLADLTGANDPDTGDIYSGFDRFGRIKDNRWYDDGSAADVDRIQYGYDRSGNRLWRENVVARSLSKEFDELYTNDLINRLKDLQRGTLNTGHSALNSTTFAECWSLDPTGNWKKYLNDANGDGTWDLNQSRTANEVNEITDITESAGPSWVTPAYNRAGNMTTLPQPADPTQSYTATYDAWNRLVKLGDGSNTVSEYAYDGAKRRVIQKTYTAGTLSETRHLYYTQPSQWQVIEERLGTSTDPNCQWVWGQRYIDDCVLRDRDTDNNGTLDERLYALQDANWNVDCLVDTSGDAQERYSYTAYGSPTFLTPTFGSRTASSYAWNTLYAGYRWETGTEVFHVRHRVYHPVLGSWVQRDPLGLAAGVNPYQYSSNSPCTFVDPTGLLEPLTWFLIAVVIAGILYLIWVLAPVCEALLGRQHSEPCNPADPEMDCGLTQLRACGFADAADDMAQGMQDGDVMCNPSDDAVGSAATTIGIPIKGQRGRPGSTIILTNPAYNCGDIAMQLLGEYQRRQGSPPGSNAELARLLACLKANGHTPDHNWAHP